MRWYRKKNKLSKEDWQKIENKIDLEVENLNTFSQYWRSERIKGIDELHIRRLRIGDWRILFLVKEGVYTLYGIGCWLRADAYKSHEMEQLTIRAKSIQ